MKINIILFSFYDSMSYIKIIIPDNKSGTVNLSYLSYYT